MLTASSSRASSAESTILAGDLNLREWEARRAGVEDSGGRHWRDAWQAAGADEALAATWHQYRLDRILFRRGNSLQAIQGGFSALQASESDHRGIRAVILVRPSELEECPPLPGLAPPLRRGARGRRGGRGVARRPTKCEACAKIEQSTAHDAGGPSMPPARKRTSSD